MRSVLVLLLVATASGAPACKKDDKKKSGAGQPAKPAVAAADAGAAAGEKPAGDTALLERGRYLSDLMGCQFCHTAFGPNGPDMANAWGGGFEVPEKFGTWR